MPDISHTLIAKSDQLNAADLIGREPIVRITKVDVFKREENPVIVHYEGEDGRPWKPCKTVRRLLAQCWSNESEKWNNKLVKLFFDPNVRYGGKKVGGIRVKAVSGMKEAKEIAMRESKTSVSTCMVEVLSDTVQTVAPKHVDAELGQAGILAAQAGMDSYIAWKDALEPDVKENIKHLHPEWLKMARAADAAKNKNTGEAERSE